MPLWLSLASEMEAGSPGPPPSRAFRAGGPPGRKLQRGRGRWLSRARRADHATWDQAQFQATEVLGSCIHLPSAATFLQVRWILPRGYTAIGSCTIVGDDRALSCAYVLRCELQGRGGGQAGTAPSEEITRHP